MQRNLRTNRRKVGAAMSTDDCHNNDDLPSAPCINYYRSRGGDSRTVRAIRGVQQTILHQQYVGYQSDIQRALLCRACWVIDIFSGETRDESAKHLGGSLNNIMTNITRRAPARSSGNTSIRQEAFAKSLYLADRAKLERGK